MVVKTFCGDWPLGFVTDRRLSECLVDAVSLIPNLFFLLIIVPNCIYKWHTLNRCHGDSDRCHGNSDGHLSVRYPGHSLRWVVTMFVVTVQVFQMTEGAIAVTMTTGARLHLVTPHIAAVTVCVLTLVFYDFVERHHLTGYLGVLLLYWGASVGVGVMKVVCLAQMGLHPGHARMALALLLLLLLLLLFALDVYLITRLKYFLHTCRSSDPPVKSVSEDVVFVHPYANFLSRICWQWLTPLLGRGYKTPLKLTDLGTLPETERAQVNVEHLKKVFEEEHVRRKSGLSLRRVFVTAYWPVMGVVLLLQFLSDQLAFVGPLCIDPIVQYVISTRERSHNVTSTQDLKVLSVSSFLQNGYVLALICFVSMMLKQMLFQNSFFLASRQAIRCKGAVQAMVYAKSLRLSPWSLSDGEMSVGQVMNHMSVDSLNIVFLFMYVCLGACVPIQLVAGVWWLSVQLGMSALVISAFIVVLIPVELFLAKMLADKQKFILGQMDERLKKCNETLQNMKLLKLYAWEGVFQRSIEATRRRELKLLLQAAMLRVASVIIVDGAPLLVVLFTFSLYPYISSEPMHAGKMFSSLALIYTLHGPITIMPLFIGVVAHSTVSMKRLGRFLTHTDMDTQGDRLSADNGAPMLSNDKEMVPLLPDKDHHHGNPMLTAAAEVPTDGAPRQGEGDKLTWPGLDKPSNDTGNFAVSIQSGYFSSNEDSQDPMLSDINITVPSGKLTMIVGGVGSGKSLLLSVLTGELHCIMGRVAFKPGQRIAYSSQRAWLMNTSLRENILFGRPFDIDRYNQVVEVCALRPDLEMLPAGDETEIGEKGINLSGGQKQRISLARCFYSDAQLVILDDPLSALDVHVTGHVMKTGIKNFLLRENRTVVVTTHQLQHLTHAHHIIAMENGGIRQQGSMKEIKQKDNELYESWKTAVQNCRSDQDRPKNAPEDAVATSTPKPKYQQPWTPMKGAFSFHSLTTLGESSDEDVATWQDSSEPQQREEERGKSSEKGELIEEEEKALGAVSIHVYLRYVREASVTLVLTTLIAYLLRPGLKMAADYWLAHWTSIAHQAAINASDTYWPENSTVTPGEPYDVGYYVGYFALFCCLAIVAGTVAIIALELTCLRAAKHLHAHMLRGLLRAPARFFDVTPLGRILNRFSGDTNIIDEQLPVCFDFLLYLLTDILFALLVNIVSNPYFLLPIVPVFLLYLAVQRFYIASSREMQRLENISKSPLLAQFSETLGGLTTIRSYKQEKAFQERNWRRIDENNTAMLFRNTATSWMAVRLDTLGAVIAFAAAVLSVTSGLRGTDPAFVAIAITYAVLMANKLQWTMKFVSEAEMHFNSVERVCWYSKVTAEIDHHGQQIVPPDDWPAKGEVTFESVSLSYDTTLEPVVTDFSLHVHGGETVGLCGRTGSGKSSVTLSLFRINHICAGRILIDGLDISRIGLHTLRSRLTVIPQDPVLFSGTLRFNLDTEGSRDDSAIWRVLETVQMKAGVLDLPEKLDFVVTEGGENFSVGERQLLCIARAIMRDSRLLIMDEATASVDLRTDQVIQEVLRTQFTHSTVVIIAHRVSSILTSDNVVVLSAGKVLEVDTPYNLRMRDSVFASMVNQVD